MDNSLSPDVQMQLMRPAQLEAAGKELPAVYVPFGLIEWHGRHLPLGNDALKAHAFLVKTAEQFGGVVYPPVFFHDGFDRTHLEPVLTDLFTRLKNTGYRVIMGVSGHNVQGQIDMVEEALKPVMADGTCTGRGLWEVTLSHCDESATDHAAKWETSNMMFFYPDRVDMATLGTDEIVLDMSPPHGIGGLDPREHASAAVGELNCELASAALGAEARRLLESLPAECQAFGRDRIEPGQDGWWMV